MRYFIHSFQFGPSTNSSSTHSVVILNEGHGIKDDDVEGHNFGWNYFTAASPEAKAAYLVHSIVDHLVPRNYAYKDRALTMAEGVVGDIINEGRAEDDRVEITVNHDGYIDHDSHLNFIPRGRVDGADATKFTEQAFRFFMDPRVVILGGNDNDDYTHPVNDEPRPKDAPDLSFLKLIEEGDVPDLRWDQRDQYWTMVGSSWGGELFNMRFRWSADAGPPIVRSEIPELVDMSVGNQCSTGCLYCYRGSTPDAGWASVDSVVALAQRFYNMGTREIALGGGDPMQHPEIDTIVQKIHRGSSGRLYITTRELGWLRDPARVALHKEHVNAWGFSVDNLKGLKRALAAFTKAGIDVGLVTIQLVVGAIGESQLKTMLTYCAGLPYGKRPRILLLGYKTTGFGDRVVPKVVSPEILRIGHKIGIDTVLAEQWASWLKENAWSGSYRTREGAFSCFVDAQKMRLYKSSFDRAEGHPIKHTTHYGTYINEQDVRNAYAAMQVAAEISAG